MKTEGPSPMVIVGSITIGSEEETSFVAAINADGSLADDYSFYCNFQQVPCTLY
jgi:hypothetical protein